MKKNVAKTKKATNNANNNRPISIIKPFLGEDGNQREIASSLISLIPTDFCAYHEPFLGDGAFFFELASRDLLRGKRVVLSADNEEIAVTYVAVRDNVVSLIEELDKLQLLPRDESTYLQIRGRKPATLSNLQLAARTIYLHNTCARVACLVNERGEFDAPFDPTRDQRIFDEDVLLADSVALQGVTIQCYGDYGIVVNDCQPGDLVYLDPPRYGEYFTDGLGFPFDQHDHKDMSWTFDMLANWGVNVFMAAADRRWVRKRYINYRQVPLGQQPTSEFRGRGDSSVRALAIIGWMPTSPETDGHSLLSKCLPTGWRPRLVTESQFPYGAGTPEIGILHKDGYTVFIPFTDRARKNLKKFIRVRSGRWGTRGAVTVNHNGVEKARLQIIKHCKEFMIWDCGVRSECVV